MTQLHPSREITLGPGESKEAVDCYYRHYVRASVRSEGGGELLPLRLTEGFWDVDNQWSEYPADTLHRDDQAALWMTSLDDRKTFPAVRLDSEPQVVESVSLGWRGANRIGGGGKLRLRLQYAREIAGSTFHSLDSLGAGVIVGPHLPSKLDLGIQVKAVRLAVQDLTAPDPNGAPTWFLSLSSMQVLGRVGGTHEEAQGRLSVSESQNGRPLVTNHTDETAKATLWLLVPAEG